MIKPHNTSEADLFKAVQEQDQRYRTRGFKPHAKKAPMTHSDVCATHHAVPTKSESLPGGRPWRSSRVTAEALGISTTMVERIRYIIDWACPRIIEAIETGTMGLMEGYNQTKAMRLSKTLLEGTQEQAKLAHALMAFSRREVVETKARGGFGTQNLDTLYRLTQDLQTMGLLSPEEGRAILMHLLPLRSKVDHGKFKRRSA